MDYECRYFWEQSDERACCMGGGKRLGGIKSITIMPQGQRLTDINLLTSIADSMTENEGDRVSFGDVHYLRKSPK